LVGCLSVQGTWIFFGIDEVRAHMVLDDLGHQTGDCATHACDEVHYLFATGLTVERPFDGLDLASKAADTRHQLLFFTNGMGHGGHIR
jgi:hypothetical protein